MKNNSKFKIKHLKLLHDYGEIKMSALHLILDPLFVKGVEYR